MRLTLLHVVFLVASWAASLAAAQEHLKLEWEKNYLTIAGTHLPGEYMKIHYLEAYCRDRSSDADWVQHTLVGHETRLVRRSQDGAQIDLECRVKDGLRVEHFLRAGRDEVDLRIVARNETNRRSEAHWAQPCIRVDRFTGAGQSDYLSKSFIFLDGKLTRFPTREWATQARYTPGQVWAAPGVDRRDVNPRPLSTLTPSSGLIGCFSKDETMLFAVAFEPYQELFQGVAVCLHSDFRLGGLAPGETKTIRGKLYFLPADVDALLVRYRRDFPEHVR